MSKQLTRKGKSQLLEIIGNTSKEQEIKLCVRTIVLQYPDERAALYGPKPGISITIIL